VADRVLIPLPSIGVLALSGDAYRDALAEGAKACAAPTPSAGPTEEPLLVDAEKLAQLTSTSASWWESAARDLDCPSLFVGRVRRFKVRDALAWLESVQERSTDGRALKCGAAPRART
jgi:hypothetical protein